MCTWKRVVTGEKPTRVCQFSFKHRYIYQYSVSSSQQGIPVDTRRTSMEPVSSDLHYCPVTQ